MRSPLLRSPWARRGLTIVAGTSLVLAALIGPPWFRVLVPDHAARKFLLALLLAAEPAYGATLGVVAAGLVACGVIVARARRRRRPWPVAARGLLLLASVLVAIAMAEVAAGARWAWTHQLPAMPTLADRPEPRDPGSLDVAVIGSSSAYGLPFEKWLSTGRLVAWKLQEVFPGRRVRLDVLAEPGVHLERMQQKLAMLRRWPDLLIIYSGHNEFTYRYRWSRSVAYYDDDAPPREPGRLIREWAGRFSPLCAMIREAIDANGLGETPPPEVTRSLVDVPACTREEYRERLDDFRRRLEAIVSHCERVGTVPVLLIPPGNDAGFEPNRSTLPPDTPRAERAAFARRFLQIRDAERDDPAGAVASYRAILAEYPGFAEAHYRLARLLERAGQAGEADLHYRAARDLDGLPMRCPGDFQGAYREVAARHPKAILVDGQAAIADASPCGILGDSSFLDAMHPNVRGHARLARAVLDGLRARRALGWPPGTPTPEVDPASSAAHFGLGSDGWVVACDWGATFFERTAYIRYDPSERLAWIARYRRASRAIADGRDPDDVGLPGVGVRPISRRSSRPDECAAAGHAP